MHSSRALAVLLPLLLSCAVPASAQEMYPGQDVIVNPGPAGNGVLLYPGGKYGRVVHPLLQPGEPYPGMAEKPIHLHMPHRHVARRVKPAAPPQAVATAVPSAPSAPAAPASAPPPNANMLSSDSATGFSDFDTIAPAQPAKRASAVAPKPAAPHPAVAAPAVAKATPPKPVPVPAALKPTTAKPATAAATTAAPVPFSLTPEPGESVTPTARVASAEPPPAQTAQPSRAASQATAGLVRQSQILFGPGVADPVPESIDAIKGLASPLNSALAGGASRVQVVAYGGSRGDKSSDARRLSLKRALIIRQLLIDGGVPSDRIDVRAMGGATDNDPTDRVDVFTKS